MPVLLRALSLALVLTACGGSPTPIPVVPDPTPEVLTVHGTVNLGASTTPELVGRPVTLVWLGGEPSALPLGQGVIAADGTFTLVTDPAAVTAALRPVYPMRLPADCTGTWTDSVPVGMRGAYPLGFVVTRADGTPYPAVLQPTGGPVITADQVYQLEYATAPATFDHEVTCTSGDPNGSTTTASTHTGYDRGWNLTLITNRFSGSGEFFSAQRVPMTAQLSLVAPPMRPAGLGGPGRAAALAGQGR